jgi:hypothetical protein
MDPDLTPDPTPFFFDFKNAKKYLFLYFFLTTCPQAHHLQPKKFNFLLNFCVKILFCRHYFNTYMRKGKDPDTGGPKTCGSCGSGSPTLLFIVLLNIIHRSQPLFCKEYR